MINILLAGILVGFVFAVQICSGFLRTMKNTVDPPSKIAKTAAVISMALFCIVFIGPVFSFVYHFLFVRFFAHNAWWIFGGLHTIVLGVVVNIYACRRRLKDLRLIMTINIGSAITLGWLIPLIYYLMK